MLAQSELVAQRHGFENVPAGRHAAPPAGSWPQHAEVDGQSAFVVQLVAQALLPALSVMQTAPAEQHVAAQTCAEEQQESFKQTSPPLQHPAPQGFEHDDMHAPLTQDVPLLQQLEPH